VSPSHRYVSSFIGRGGKKKKKTTSEEIEERRGERRGKKIKAMPVQCSAESYSTDIFIIVITI
jgi:hypothetical protein